MEQVMSDLDASIRRALAGAAQDFEPELPPVDGRTYLSARLGRRHRGQVIGVVVLALVLLAAGFTTVATTSGGSSVATLAAAGRTTGSSADTHASSGAGGHGASGHGGWLAGSP